MEAMSAIRLLVKYSYGYRWVVSWLFSSYEFSWRQYHLPYQRVMRISLFLARSLGAFKCFYGNSLSLLLSIVSVIVPWMKIWWILCQFDYDFSRLCRLLYDYRNLKPDLRASNRMLASLISDRLPIPSCPLI